MTTGTAGPAGIPPPPAPGLPPTGLPPFTVSPGYQASATTQAAVAAASRAVAQAFKPGWQTTEFWLHVASVAGPIVLQAMGQSQSALAIAIAQAAPMLYTIARTYLKTRGVGA